jgi:hypothetical protein
MRARKVDANHARIVAAFARLGCSVLDLSRVGQGCPDLLISKHGRNVLVEIKDGDKSPSRRRLTPDQCGFHSTWKGRLAIVKDLADVEMVVNTIQL